ncbi:hypothetical protein ES702_01250 [subsurface metagenome]
MKSLLIGGKKAQMGKLQSIVITIMIIGVIIGVGLLVLEEFEETLGDTAGAVANETVVLADISAGGVFVAYNSTTGGNVSCYHSFSPYLVINESTGGVVDAANYSYNAVTGQMWNLTDEAILQGGVNVSYTFSYSISEACQGLDDTVNATRDIPGWLAIIIILLIVGILLFIVFRVLPSGGEESGGFGGFSGFGSSSSSVAEI